MKKGTLLTWILTLFIPVIGMGQKLPAEPFYNIPDSVYNLIHERAFVTGKIRLDSVKLNNSTLSYYFTPSLSEYPWRESSVAELRAYITQLTPGIYNFKKIQIFTAGKQIESYIPPITKEGEIDKRESKKLRRKYSRIKEFTILKENISKPYKTNKGLENKHLAIWQSHGYYYEQKLLRWEWQRARIFQTVEDLYTQSYVLPFLVPMLENAGANVLLPRERDTQIHEIIVDNDTPMSGYTEFKGENSWLISGRPGFANPKREYVSGENPFTMGSAKVATCIKKSDKISYCTWTPNIPEKGEYAVYISYHSFPNSASDAIYTVKHKGGTTQFKINQQIGGGTWIYLGTFLFSQGNENGEGVTLTNLSNQKNCVVSADAVKFGGGFGNIARKPSSEGALLNRKSSSNEPEQRVSLDIDPDPITSGYPRFTEAARYWLQWAGFSDTIYSPNNNANDYNDDYMSRGRWVNVLSGGSKNNPDEEGYGIPLDMAFAFHTDAGTTLNDSIIGTLGIFTSISQGEDKFPNGTSRFNGRYLTDLIQTEIVNDIKNQYEPNWQRRGIWDKSYSESRTPKVPTMLLELLSHQNFADMRYGLDPQFRFTVSRAIYKGILKYLSAQRGYDYVVQPLPVQKMVAQLDSQKVTLSWEPTTDISEPTAIAKRYIVYTRCDDGSFDNGTITENSVYTLTIERGKIYSFKVAALNEGGESFPSEILSVYKAPQELGKVMIVNGFTRVSAPASFATRDTTRAGFIDNLDHGVPYISDISFIGSQYEFRREIPWMDDDSPGFGASYANYETKVVAGNTFDYPYIHGKAFAINGYSFVSASRDGYNSLKDSITNLYNITDFIMGKQLRTQIGRGAVAPKYQVFDSLLINKIESYASSGGNIIISGANIATDVWDSFVNDTLAKRFVTSTLKYIWRSNQASITGKVKGAQNPYGIDGTLSFGVNPNESVYCVESPDAIEPADKKGWTIMRYADNNLSAAVGYTGDYNCFSFGFPLETIEQEQLNNIIKQLTTLFNKSKE